MAAPSHFDQATLNDFVKGISDNIITDNALLSSLEDKGRIKFGCGGAGFQFVVRVSRANLGGVVTDQNQGTAKPISTTITCSGKYRPYLWRLFENQFEIDRNQYAPAGSKIFDQKEEDLNTIKQEATERVGQHLYGDGSTTYTGDASGATPPAGLEYIILSSGTYFGQARATYTALNSQLVTCTNPSLYTDGINNNLIKSLDECYTAVQLGEAPDSGVSSNVAKSKNEPDLIISTSANLRKYRMALNPQHQYISDKADARKEIAYGNAAFKFDPWCTSERIYVLTSKYLQVLVVGPQIIRNMKQISSHSPVGEITVLGGQLQMISKMPRYLGKITTSGT